MGRVAELGSLCHIEHAMKKRISLSAWQQFALAAAFLLPWVAFGVLSTDVLPETWRFQTWPDSIRMISILLFAVFIVADAVFAFWYLFSRSHADVA